MTCWSCTRLDAWIIVQSFTLVVIPSLCAIFLVFFLLNEKKKEKEARWKTQGLDIPRLA
jgi:hypothetical protein